MDNDDWLFDTLRILNQPLQDLGLECVTGMTGDVPTRILSVESIDDITDNEMGIYKAIAEAIILIVSQLHSFSLEDAINISNALDTLLLIDGSEPGIDWPNNMYERLVWLFSLQNNEVEEVISVVKGLSAASVREFATLGPLALHCFSSRVLLPIDLQETLYDGWNAGLSPIYKAYWHGHR